MTQHSEKKLHLQAPAKVNYRLDVLRRREDGYHDLRMVMQRVNLCDEVEVSLTGTPGIRVVCNTPGAPNGEGNIAWKAANALLSLSDWKGGVDISISKRIPIGAGLGGGSSDAATVLMGVNELLGLSLSEERLREIGVKLGADVPFFIFKKTAIAEGIGDRLTALEGIPKLWVVLVNPGIHISTGWVYQSLRLTGEKTADIIPRLYGSVTDVCAILSNDLEQVSFERYPALAALKEELLEVGAAGSLMSGSGSTVFALFAEEKAAKSAAEEIGRRHGWLSVAVETL